MIGRNRPEAAIGLDKFNRVSQSEFPTTQTSKMIIYTLLKIFETKNYAEEFLSGSLYMNTLKYFAEEHVDNAGELRGDSYEGLIGHYQPSQISTLSVNEIKISGDQLASPILVHSNNLLASNVFCMFAVNSGACTELSDENLDIFRESLKIPPACHGLGAYCVVLLNTSEFLARCDEALDKLNLPFQRSMVNYFDDQTFHGRIPEAELGFHKRKRFSVQQEYRLRVDPVNELPGPLRLEIGSLKDIAVIVTPQQFNDGLQFHPDTLSNTE
ncbi:hypothetical protein [Pseudomonas sp. AB6]|uniref:hypothetical protein n=1 Tax=Pseudomonas sp. AB6 TaxID=3048598 RepID=UPI002AB332E4|nr:hypothetical protein [Pseudomonas sp. AB6]MDY7560814.1 hypothetical protein [Pseudomonas sp. AB6]